MKLDKKLMLKILLLISFAIGFYWILCQMDKVTSILKNILDLFSPFITGGIIAFILNVPVRAYERLLSGIKKPGIRRALAIILTIISVVIVLALVFLLLLPQLISTLVDLIDQLKTLPAWISDVVKNLLDRYPTLYGWIKNNLDLKSFDWGSLVQDLVPQIKNVFTHLFSVVGSFATGLFNAFMSIVFAVYCLFNKDTLARQGRKVLYAFFPELFADRVVRVLRLSNLTFSNFLSGQCVEAVILGSLFAVAMAIFNMPYIPLVSVLIAVTAFIPIVGALIGCFVGAFLMAVSDPVMAIGFIALSIVVQQLENNLIYPRVVGTSIGLPGMWVLVAVSVGGSIMGVGGMFLMIPLSSVVYSVFRIYTNKRLKKREVDESKLRCHPISFKKKRPGQKHKETETELNSNINDTNG